MNLRIIGENMKILVLGANGMAGHVISAYLDEKGYDVYGFARSKLKNKNITGFIGDARNIESIIRIIESEKIDIVVNAIGILNDDCDKNPLNSIYINSYFPHLLASKIINSNVKIIHLSTDCVFSGTSGPYTELSKKDGTRFYDQSKSLGELIDDKNLTFRTSIIGPDINKDGKGLVNWFLSQKDKVDGYEGVLWTGVTTLVLAEAIEKAIKERITGVYHLVNNKTISKFKLLTFINAHMNRNIIINKVYLPIISKQLINTREDLSYEVPQYEDMIKSMIKWISRHKRLYQHYE